MILASAKVLWAAARVQQGQRVQSLCRDANGILGKDLVYDRRHRHQAWPEPVGNSDAKTGRHIETHCYLKVVDGIAC